MKLDNWVTVPTNSTLTIHKQTVMVHPIIDQYYSYNPYHMRSSNYVVAKGLVSNEKGTIPETSSPPTSTPIRLPEDVNNSSNAPSEKKSSLPKNMPADYSEIRSTLRPLLSSKPKRNNPLDVGRISPVSARDPAKPQEQGNTKKKRCSLAETDFPAPLQIDRSPTSTGGRSNSFGDPAKIAQFFPELDSLR